jgi:tryptophan-rich sensory protein
MRGREDVLATGVVAGVTALTAIGSRISSNDDSAWFRALRKPRWEPSGAVIGPVWAVLYACTGLSATMLCASGRRTICGGSWGSEVRPPPPRAA